MFWSRRLFNILMRAYPRRFREQRGADMWLTFESHLIDARSGGLFAVLGLWLREITALWRDTRRARIATREYGRTHRIRNPRHRHALLDTYWLDVKLGLRMLVKSPGLTIVGGLGMAVAMAMSAGALAFFHWFMYPTIPLEEGNRIVGLENWDIEINNEERGSIHDFFTWRDEMESVVEIGAFRTIGRNLIIRGAGAGNTANVEPVLVAEITGAGFQLARVPPLLGRGLVPDDERRDAPQVLVIGYDAWQTRFLGDSTVVGREVWLGNVVHTIVGVMPEDFLFPESHHFWTPLRIVPGDYERGSGPDIFIFGRLADGVSRAEAQVELAAIGRRTALAFPETYGRLRPQVLPYTYPLTGVQDIDLWELGSFLSLVSLLLVVVAVNVAVLTYARTARRRSEIAVRVALGASRGRVVLQLFVEALVLAAVAGVVGLFLARVGLRQGHLIILEEVDGAPFWMNFAIPPAAILYTIGLSVGAAAIVGVVPGLQATGRSLQASLRQVGAGVSAGLGKTWTVLIAAQVGIAVAGVSASIAMGWSQIRFSTIDATYPREEFLAGRLVLDEEPPPGVDQEAYARAFAERYSNLQMELLGRLSAEAGISAVAFGISYPGAERRASILVEGADGDPGVQQPHRIRFNNVSVGFFDAFDASIVVGRAFHESDLSGQTSAVIVNRSFARQILGDGSAVGRRIRYDETGLGDEARWYEIVGVVSDLYESAIDPTVQSPVLYHAMAPGYAASPVLIAVRSPGGTTPAMVTRVREIASSVDASLRMAGMDSLERMQRQAEIATRLTAMVVTFVIASVLLLSAAGIYAMLSFAITQRRREIGIRTALGARARSLILTVFRRAIGQLAIGILLGVGLSAFITPRVGAELPVHIAVVLLGVSTLMIFVGVVAAIGPARRGLRIQPTEALRGAD